MELILEIVIFCLGVVIWILTLKYETEKENTRYFIDVGEDYKMKMMNLEKPYKVFEPTDTAIDYSQCYLPFFESKRDGWLYYKDNIVSVEESFKLREMGFSEPTHMTWYLDSYFYQLNPKNHNDSNIKISLPTREQADCFLNGR